jgi:hypothetical protein
MGCTYSAPRYIPPAPAKKEIFVREGVHNAVDVPANHKTTIIKKSDTIAKKLLKKLYGF